MISLQRSCITTTKCSNQRFIKFRQDDEYRVSCPISVDQLTVYVSVWLFFGVDVHHDSYLDVLSKWRMISLVVIIFFLFLVVCSIIYILPVSLSHHRYISSDDDVFSSMKSQFIDFFDKFIWVFIRWFIKKMRFENILFISLFRMILWSDIIEILSNFKYIWY